MPTFIKIALGVSSGHIGEMFIMDGIFFFFFNGFIDKPTEKTGQQNLTESVPKCVVRSKEVPFGG